MRAHPFSSQADVEQGGGELGGARADHVAVTLFLTFSDAASKIGHRVDHGADNTGGDNDVLVGVLVVGENGEIFEESADIAVGVDDVGSLGQANVRDVELGSVLGKPDLISVQDGETIADSLGETGTAVLIEARGEAIDEAEEEEFVVISLRVNKLCSLLGTGLLEVC